MSDTKEWTTEDWEVHHRERKEALAKVKPGDKVAYGRRSLLTVDRVTATQIAVGKRMRFHRVSGRQLGGGSSISAHPDDIKKVEETLAEEGREEARRKARQARDAADTHLQAAKELINLVMLGGGDAQVVKEAYAERQLLYAISALKAKGLDK